MTLDEFWLLLSLGLFNNIGASMPCNTLVDSSVTEGKSSFERQRPLQFPITDVLLLFSFELHSMIDVSWS